MLKLIITGAIIYFIYRFFIAPPVLNDGQRERRSSIKDESPPQEDEGDYIDYEEVD